MTLKLTLWFNLKKLQGLVKNNYKVLPIGCLHFYKDGCLIIIPSAGTVPGWFPMILF